MLKGKRIILGVTGGIAAYKSAALASMLIKAGAHVDVIMTENACKMISPVTFEAITKTRAVTDTFDRAHSFEIEHISLAEGADFAVIAPATANIIAKLANGICDDMLSTTMLACRAKKLIVPAMNTNMYENPIQQENLARLESYGFLTEGPQCGRLACGVVGAGKMSEPEQIFERIVQETAFAKDLTGKKIIVTAGPTCEAIDPVRYITNHSSGKMGYALAVAAARRGAEVVLISGKTALEKPRFMKVINVVSAADMYDAVMCETSGADALIMAAAVADYTPSEPADQKIKKQSGVPEIRLSRTKDIIKSVSERGDRHLLLCGFSMETQNVEENSRKKLESKGLDMICANSLRQDGAGFGVNTNILKIITPFEELDTGLVTKDEAAHRVLDEVKKGMERKIGQC